jgi:hypothetical protein
LVGVVVVSTVAVRAAPALGTMGAVLAVAGFGVPYGPVWTQPLQRGCSP